jgi:hypothetical protein
MIGCVSISFPQFTPLYNALVQSQPHDPLDEIKWRLQYGNYSTEVYLVSSSQGLVFLSKNNDILFFDGDNISKIQYLAGQEYDLSYVVSIHNETHPTDGSQSDTNIKDKKYAHLNQFTRNGSIYTTYECSEWRTEVNNEPFTSTKVSVQYCNTPEGVIKNIQHLDDDKLTYIEQWYASLSAPLILKK